MPFYRHRRATRRLTAAATALTRARERAGLGMTDLARAMGVHQRTVKRWEVGETHPSAKQWGRLVALFTRTVPDAARELASSARVPFAPIPSAPLADARAIEEALFRAADHLDVPARRARAAVRELVAGVVAAHGTLDDLLRAAQEKPDDVVGHAGSSSIQAGSSRRSATRD